MPQKKVISTIIALSISGFMTLVFFTSSGPSTAEQNTSEMAQMGISENLRNMIFGVSENFPTESGPGEKIGLDSCSTANAIIGKNGIAKCYP